MRRDDEKVVALVGRVLGDRVRDGGPFDYRAVDLDAVAEFLRVLLERGLGLGNALGVVDRVNRRGKRRSVRRDDEVLEVYARTLIELISKRTGAAAKPLLLAISIKEHSSDMFKAIMQEVDEHRVW